MAGSGFCKLYGIIRRLSGLCKVLVFLLEWGFLLEYWRAYKLYNVLLGCGLHLQDRRPKSQRLGFRIQDHLGSKRHRV